MESKEKATLNMVKKELYTEHGKGLKMIKEVKIVQVGTQVAVMKLQKQWEEKEANRIIAKTRRLKVDRQHRSCLTGLSTRSSSS